MDDRKPLSDVVVVLPGITGSALAVGQDKNEVWGLSGRALINGIRTLGNSVFKLTLPEGLGDSLPEKPKDGLPNDGVSATRLIPDLHGIPGVWSGVKGYSGLTKQLMDWFTITEAGDDNAGNLLTFPYDWRLSNVVSARRLEDVVVPALEQWRKQSKNRDAKLIFVCHSMGGLVARWFLEVLGGWELTRTLITVGTPYQGSVNALESLVNGVSPALGLFKDKLTDLVRSFPSMYELLPTYQCMDSGGKDLLPLSDAGVPGLRIQMLKTASAFHRKIAEGVANRPQDAYRIIAIKGVRQPTSQSARLTAGRIEPLRIYRGIDRGGDGTVPRPSSHPPEWPDEKGGPVVFAAQRHGTLQETESVLIQLFGLLSDREGGWMGGEQIGMDVPAAISAGESLNVEVTAEDPTLALTVSVTPHDDLEHPVVEPQLLTNEGEGRYTAQFQSLPPGTYQVTVASAVATRLIDPVSDFSLVWDPDAA